MFSTVAPPAHTSAHGRGTCPQTLNSFFFISLFFFFFSFFTVIYEKDPVPEEAWFFFNMRMKS